MARGQVSLWFFLVDSAPGLGPDLPSHPYGEVLVVRAGHVRAACSVKGFW